VEIQREYDRVKSCKWKRLKVEGDEFSLKTMAHYMDRSYFSYSVNVVVEHRYMLSIMDGLKMM
jgi:hypothetical protein